MLFPNTVVAAQGFGALVSFFVVFNHDSSTLLYILGNLLSSFVCKKCSWLHLLSVVQVHPINGTTRRVPEEHSFVAACESAGCRVLQSRPTRSMRYHCDRCELHHGSDENTNLTSIPGHSSAVVIVSRGGVVGQFPVTKATSKPRGRFRV